MGKHKFDPINEGIGPSTSWNRKRMSRLRTVEERMAYVADLAERAFAELDPTMRRRRVEVCRNLAEEFLVNEKGEKTEEFFRQTMKTCDKASLIPGTPFQA